MNKLLLSVFATVCMLFTITSCKKSKPQQTIRTFSVASFNKVEAAGLLDIQVVKSNSFFVKAEGDVKDLNNLKAEVINGELTINYGNVQLAGAIKVTIAMPVLDAFYIKDMCKANISGFTQASEVEGKLTNRAKATVQMNVSQFTVEATVNSDLILNGQAEKVYALAEDGSSVDAYAISGMFGRALAYKNSTIKIKVSHTLNASATEKSFIYFKGNPQNRFTSELSQSQIIEE
jgi:hypothetical protein